MVSAALAHHAGIGPVGASSRCRWLAAAALGKRVDHAQGLPGQHRGDAEKQEKQTLSGSICVVPPTFGSGHSGHSWGASARLHSPAMKRFLCRLNAEPFKLGRVLAGEAVQFERRLPTAGAATVRDIGRSRRSSAILENGCESSFHAGGEAEGVRRDRQPGARAERQKGGSVGGKAWVCGGHLRGRLRFWGQDMPAESSPTSASVTGGDSRAELSNASTQGLPSTRRRRSS